MPYQLQVHPENGWLLHCSAREARWHWSLKNNGQTGSDIDEYFLEPVSKFQRSNILAMRDGHRVPPFIFDWGSKIVFIDDMFFSLDGLWILNKFVRGSHHRDLDYNIRFKYDFFRPLVKYEIVPSGHTPWEECLIIGNWPWEMDLSSKYEGGDMLPRLQYHGECLTKLKSDDFGRNFSKIQLKRRSELLFQIRIPILKSTRIPCLPESGRARTRQDIFVFIWRWHRKNRSVPKRYPGFSKRLLVEITKYFLKD